MNNSEKNITSSKREEKSFTPEVIGLGTFIVASLAFKLPLIGIIVGAGAYTGASSFVKKKRDKDSDNP